MAFTDGDHRQDSPEASPILQFELPALVAEEKAEVDRLEDVFRVDFLEDPRIEPLPRHRDQSVDV